MRQTSISQGAIQIHLCFESASAGIWTCRYLTMHVIRAVFNQKPHPIRKVEYFYHMWTFNIKGGQKCCSLGLGKSLKHRRGHGSSLTLPQNNPSGRPPAQILHLIKHYSDVSEPLHSLRISCSCRRQAQPGGCCGNPRRKPGSTHLGPKTTRKVTPTNPHWAEPLFDPSQVQRSHNHPAWFRKWHLNGLLCSDKI